MTFTIHITASIRRTLPTVPMPYVVNRGSTPTTLSDIVMTGGIGITYEHLNGRNTDVWQTEC